MKKNVKLMLALLAGAMTVVSCGEDAILEDEGNKDVPTPVQGTMTFTATVGEEDETTRASLKGLDIVWNQGDEISVFSSANFETNNKMTLTAGAGETSGSFTGDCAKGTDYYAFYPYNSDNAYYEKNPVIAPIDIFGIAWNGLQQTAVAGSFDPRTPMMARTSGVEEGATTVQLQFKNILSFVKLTTDFPCKSITLTSNKESVNLAANRLNLKDQSTGLLSIHNTTDPNPSVELKGADDALIDAGTYYIAVLPGTLSEGFKLTFSGVNDTDLTLSKSTSKSVTLNRSEALNVGTFKVADFRQNTFFGSGTEADPYQITSYDDWVLLSSKLNSDDCSSYQSKYYVLTNDIDCRDKSPLIPFAMFTGHFDGKGHTIMNYKINTDRKQNSRNEVRTGLFNAIQDATIENLNAVFDGFANVDLTGRYSSSDGVGGYHDGSTEESPDDFEFSPFICNAYSSTVNNCHLSANSNLYINIDHKVRTFRFGCLICQIAVSGTVTNCSNSLSYNINAATYSPSYRVFIGGIVCRITAEDKDVKIDRCRNTGDLSLRGKNDLFAGGIVASVEDNLDDVELYVTNCVNTGSVWAGVLGEGEQSSSLDDAIAGGIIGVLDSDGEDIVPHIYNCLNTGSILASQVDKSYAGGIVGEAFSPTLPYDDPHLFNCANRGVIRSSGGYSYPFVGNTGDYDLIYAKCCHNDYCAPGELQVPQIIASEMNENIGSAKIKEVTKNSDDWVGYTFGCCRWTGDGDTLDLDFSSSED